MLQLVHQHVGKSKALATREIERQLVIEHALVRLRLVAAENGVLAYRIAHALDQHPGEETLELLGYLAQRTRILLVRACLELLETGEVAVDPGVCAFERGRHGCVASGCGFAVLK
jgi:hypothetical protein